jgi:phosphotransferase system IIA component
LWIKDIVLLDDRKIKVRYLYSDEKDGEKLFRMDIEKLNKDGDDNIINDVILNHDIIKVWTNLDNDIKRISFKYNNASYIIKFNEE